MDTENMQIPTPPPLPPAVYLEIIFGPEAGRRHPLSVVELVIGRGEAADFVLDDPTVSRRHATVCFENGAYRLRDLGSANGTRIEGRAVEEATLTAGTTLELGGAILQLALGVAPAEAIATGPLHRQDTEKLPALDPPPEPLHEVPPDPAPRFLGMQRTRTSRSMAPSQLFAQLMSWLVVLCIAIGGVMLLLNLLEATVAFDGGGSEEALAISAPRQEKAQRVVTPPKKKKNDEDSSLGDVPVDDAPDVAQEKYAEAESARAAGNLQTALVILLEVTARYPEFQPSGASTVPEQVSELERDLAYAGILSWGNQVVADDGSDVVRLQHLLSELTTIPATERLYGEEAIQLADKARIRMRDLLENGERPTEEPEELAVVEDVRVDDVVESPEAAEDVIEGPSPEALEAIEAARGRADELYRSRAFSSAATRLLEVARTLPEGEEREELQSAANNLAAFEVNFSEARRLARMHGDLLQRAGALEKALQIDEKLAGKYIRELRTELADVLVDQATADLEAQRYEIAREHLERARGYDRSAREVSRLTTLFASKGASLLRAAKAAGEPGEKRRLAKYAQLMAAPESALEKESAALLDTLGGEAQ
jgi:hypothetical protein